MNKKYLKRTAAFVMAATLAFANCTVAFAEGNPTSGSGTADGTGTSNGHLEQKVVSVTLPLDSTTVFNYTADPEGLVQATKPSDGTTGKLKDGTEVTPNTDRVYFNLPVVTADADKDIVARDTATYASTSDTVRVFNESSDKINLTVGASIAANDNNMAIADAAADIATATTTPTLHFDLITKAKGGSDVVTPVAKGSGDVAKAEKEIEVDGVAANFEVTQSGTGATGKYVYSLISGKKPKDFNYVDISLKGACSAADTTDELIAPKVVMTWGWVDPAATPEVVTYTLVRNANNGALQYTFATDKPTGELTAVSVNGTSKPGLVNQSKITYNATNGKFTVLSDVVTSLSLEQDNTTIVATIGDNDYTFTY